MLVVKQDDIRRLHSYLKELDGGRALPFAAKEALNTSAFAARREWAKQGRKQMTVRNKWTFKGQFHQVVKARARKSINQMQAVTGNKHRYMAMQEKGFAKIRGGGLQIPTTQSRIGGDHKRVVSRSYWRNKIGANIGPRYDIRNSRFGGSARRYVKGSVRAARAQAKRFVYLEFSNRNRGIYDIGNSGKRLKLVWDMSHKHTKTKPHPMLRTTLSVLEPNFRQFHRKALEEQIRFVLKKRGLKPQGSGLTGVSRLVPR